MAGFALIGIAPLLVYCVIQTFRDALARRAVMAVYGTAMVLLLLTLVKRVLDDPGY